MSHEAFTAAPEYTGSAQQSEQSSFLPADSRAALGNAAPSRTGRVWVIGALLALLSRRREKKELQYLLQGAPEHLLNDVGLTKEQIKRELYRLDKGTFW